MKLPEAPKLQTSLTSRDIRVVAARMAHPEDPLAEWQFEFGEWRKACAEFQQIEHETIVSPETPSKLAWRQHRYLAYLLLTHGEELALSLIQNSAVSESEKARLLEQVDAFLGALTDSLATWHGEALPVHRQALARFVV